MNTAMQDKAPSGMFAPLRHAPFRRVWLASIPSNLGLLINAVGAAWAMTVLSGRADMVALVQTALMLPYMLFALPAGAIADTYDRRKVGLVALVAATITAGALFAVAFADLLTPWLLLLLCFLNGSANAVFGPAWMSAVGEQVPRKDLPQGIALNSVSFNIARAFGPAVGGLLVAAAGPVAAFGANAASYLPMLWAQARWKRDRDRPRLPPEQVGTAIVSGLRYVGHSPPLRRSISRTFVFGIAGASIQALLPLIASQRLGGGASIFGLLLGVFGIGAVLGAALLPAARQRLTMETQIRLSLIVLAALVGGIAVSREFYLTCALLLAGGICWMQITNTLSVSIQTRAPRWVTGRAVAAFQAAMAGGLALGSWLWGSLANTITLPGAVAASAVALLLAALLGWLIPVHPIDEDGEDRAAELVEPELQIDLTGRSGPIVVMVEYEIASEDARRFYGAMTLVRGIRLRNGAYAWSLSRDIAAPEKWIERFQTPTWHDYLRQRERLTEAERLKIVDLIADPVRVRRLLERPVGSVRWKEDSIDPGDVFPPARD